MLGSHRPSSIAPHHDARHHGCGVELHSMCLLSQGLKRVLHHTLQLSEAIEKSCIAFQYCFFLCCRFSRSASHFTEACAETSLGKGCLTAAAVVAYGRRSCSCGTWNRLWQTSHLKLRRLKRPVTKHLVLSWLGLRSGNLFVLRHRLAGHGYRRLAPRPLFWLYHPQLGKEKF
jgi:hypothetical protein